jgi:hypothetical protein
MKRLLEENQTNGWLSQLTWTNHSNHLQNSKNTLNMWNEKKQKC